MIGLDTNVLVRFLVADDARQAAAATALIQAAVAKDEQLYVADPVLCELVWVLEAAYGFRKAAIVPVLHNLARAAELTFDSSDRLARAVVRFEVGRGDFADYLIAEACTDAGCQEVATFDRPLLKEAGFVAP